MICCEGEGPMDLDRIYFEGEGGMNMICCQGEGGMYIIVVRVRKVWS